MTENGSLLLSHMNFQLLSGNQWINISNGSYGHNDSEGKDGEKPGGFCNGHYFVQTLRNIPKPEPFMVAS